VAVTVHKRAAAVWAYVPERRYAILAAKENKLLTQHHETHGFLLDLLIEQRGVPILFEPQYRNKFPPVLAFLRGYSRNSI
jgi:hypothetical protein